MLHPKAASQLEKQAVRNVSVSDTVNNVRERLWINAARIGVAFADQFLIIHPRDGIRQGCSIPTLPSTHPIVSRCEHDYERGGMHACEQRVCFVCNNKSDDYPQLCTELCKA